MAHVRFEPGSRLRTGGDGKATISVRRAKARQDAGGACA